MKRLIKWVLLNYGTQKATRFVDHLKTLGFHYATTAGISLGIDDLRIPPIKQAFLLNAEMDIQDNEQRYERGQITAVERLEKALDIWNTTNETLKVEVINHFKETDIFNPVYMMAFSGARGNISQVRQLVGMRGLMADPQGQILDFPIRRNFREGLTVTEYMISCYGARKGLVDTALRTANSGYLTRRLVDVAQSVIIQQLDCEPTEGLCITPDPRQAGGDLIGRVLFEDLPNLETGKFIARKNQDISPPLASVLCQLPELHVRSPLTCKLQAVCQLCYGWNLAQQKLVQLGEAVGVLAAQSIGEPGTQLTMRTFHTGGVFAGEATEKVYAPHSGTIAYGGIPRGHHVITKFGETAFLTFSEVQIKITRTAYAKSMILTFPPFTLLFVFPGQHVLFHQSVAELSRIDLIHKTPKPDAAIQQVKKELLAPEDGHVYIEGSLPSLGQRKYKFLWILAGELIKQDYGVHGDRASTSAQPFSSHPELGDINRTPAMPFGGHRATGMQLYVTQLKTLFDISTQSRTYLVSEPATSQVITDLSLGRTYSQRISQDDMPPAVRHRLFGTILKPKRWFKTGSTDRVYTSLVPNSPLPSSDPVVGRLMVPKLPKAYMFTHTLQSHYKRVQVGATNPMSVSPEKWFHWRFIPLPLKYVRNQNKRAHRSTVSKRMFQSMQHIWQGCMQQRCKMSQTHVWAQGAERAAWRQTPQTWVVPFNVIQPWYTYSATHPFDPWVVPHQDSSHARTNPLSAILFPPNVPVPVGRHQPLPGQQSLKGPYVIPTAQGSYLNPLGWKQTWDQALESSTHPLHGEIRLPKKLVLTAKTQHTFAVASERTIVGIGSFIRAGDAVSDTQYSPYAGQVIAIQRQCLIIRRVHPYLISRSASLRVRHGELVTGGTAFGHLVLSESKAGDIVQGLPKVDELLEAREPYHKILTSVHAQLAMFFRTYAGMYGLREGCRRSLQRIRRILVDEVQAVYRDQGVFIADKHVEIIVRQMTTKVVIIDPGETGLLPGDIVDLRRVEALEFKRTFAKIQYRPILLGITRASLTAESFISAASFQETKRVLARAAVEGRLDWLTGLKENVILGRLIPAGTGLYI